MTGPRAFTPSERRRLDELEGRQKEVLDELTSHGVGCRLCEKKPEEIPFYLGCDVYTSLVDQLQDLEDRHRLLVERAAGPSDA